MNRQISRRELLTAGGLTAALAAFMYHCHMSNHEDEGMMGQFLVTTDG